jgi:hypothetical protein
MLSCSVERVALFRQQRLQRDMESYVYVTFRHVSYTIEDAANNSHEPIVMAGMPALSFDQLI